MMRTERRLGGLPLAAYIVALLAVPLSALALFGYREVQRNDEVVTATERFADIVEVRAASSVLQGPMQIERLAALGLARLDELGVEAAPVVAITGIDFAEIHADSAARFREVRLQLEDAVADSGLMSSSWQRDFAAVGARLDDTIERVGLDAGPSVAEASAAFDALQVMLDELPQRASTEAALAASPSLDEADLVSHVSAVSDVAETAAQEMRMATNAMVGVPGYDAERFGLIGMRHAEALRALEAVDAERAAELGAEFAALPRDFSLADHDDRVDFAEVRAMAEAIMGRVDYLGSIGEFATAEAATAQAAVEQRRADAEADNQRTILAFGFVGIVSLLFGAIVIRSFAGPLSRLRVQAEEISRGELSTEQLPLGGPSDIRKVTAAVNEMGSTLAVVDEQMQALARGDVDTPLRAVELPGKVGASMRDSVERVTALTARLRASEVQLAEEARIDSLTGLPNRFAVLEYLDRFSTGRTDDDLPVHHAGLRSFLAEGTEAVGVMFLDVDGFKSVNDTHGHAVGDVVLREIAQRLRGSVRDIDMVARLGGDEFLIVVGGVAEPEVLSVFGDRLIQAIERPYAVGDQLFAVSASVGATLIHRGEEPLAAIERADAAVYQAKSRGRRRVEMFDQQLQAEIEQQAEVELALRQAIHHGELRLHLQPVADLTTGFAAGAEALVRWERPGVGLVPPNDFIPIAERSGLIFDLERWVLTDACRRVAEWQLRGVGTGMRLAVNISGRHLIEGDLLAALDQAIASTGADPNLLEIELTETHLLDDVHRAQRILGAIRGRGIRVAIDDFGTGYSSMTYLQKLPVDIVKIDRSFVSSASASSFDSTVIESVVTIGRALSLEVVAEGIETPEQLRRVIVAGCTYGQGFHLARPLPADEAEAVMFAGPLFLVDPVIG